MTEPQETNWTPPSGPLGELTERSRQRALESRAAIGALETLVASMPPAPSFRAALRGERVAVVAELKRSSPSKGTLNAGLDAQSRTALYVEGGAKALSILTEPSRFGGSLSDLRDAHAAVSVPLLRKDFITDEAQLLEARAYGAAAALLIARALEPRELHRLAMAAIGYGLEPLIEVRDERELDRAMAVPHAVIGVNNRDLETLIIHPEVGLRLIPKIPADRVAIYESGISGVDGVRGAAAVGADAVLIGSVLSTAESPVELLRELSSVPRVARG